MEYTQTFAGLYISPRYLHRYTVNHVEFNYNTRSWKNKEANLPTVNGDYALLVPKDILTKDDTWINKSDMINNFNEIVTSIPNDQLRAQLNEYFLRALPADATKKESDKAIVKTINNHPEFIDYFIKFKEDHGYQAIQASSLKVKETEILFNHNVKELVDLLTQAGFYNQGTKSLNEAYQRVLYLKQVIEHNDGYRIFYVNGEPINREKDLQILYRLTWYATDCDVNSEVNNGRGPADYKISKGKRDQTLVEFKLASNSKLKHNLKHQVKVYEAANQTEQSIKVILYFTDRELEKISEILRELNLSQDKFLVTIDARPNKSSASNVRDANGPLQVQ